MTDDLARLRAAQEKADEVRASLAEAPDGPHLLVAVTDPESGQRLATCFVNYQLAGTRLHLVAS